KIKSTLKKDQIADLEALADAIKDSMSKPEASAVSDALVNPNALFKFSYGLFVLSSVDGDKHNGCIINTGIQLTDNPKRIAIAVNKANYTHDMIMNSRKFNLSILDETAPFDLFKQFGFQSGRNTEKYDGKYQIRLSENGVVYLSQYSNAFISGKVVDVQDYGTHSLFVVT
ncbi:flavin reductase family protein, partial [Enterococcus faecalis]|uniref:flavin reductase family protein n=1 Tax=Enterococcus faecalis TaxID=1351 RepID=UPI001AD6EF04